MQKLFRYLTAPVAAVTVTAVALMANPAQGQSGVGRGYTNLVAALDCPADNEIAQGLVAEISVEGVGEGGPKTPEEAFTALLDRAYRGMPRNFEVLYRDKEYAQFAYERDGARLMIVEATKVRGGWAVPGLAACDSLIQEVQQ